MKPRFKHGQLPGDLSRTTKIALREGRHESRELSRSFRRLLKLKERAKLKKQAQKEIREQTE